MREQEDICSSHQASYARRRAWLLGVDPGAVSMTMGIEFEMVMGIGRVIYIMVMAEQAVLCSSASACKIGHNEATNVGINIY